MRIYEHRLPHWRTDDATHHVVWRISWGSATLTTNERAVVEAALRFFDGKRYELVAWAVMDDHVQVVVRPKTRELERIVQSWKGYTGMLMHKAGRASPIWQKTYYQRIIRNDREWEETVSYVIYNPAERWADVEDKYRWAGSAGDWNLPRD